MDHSAPFLTVLCFLFLLGMGIISGRVHSGVNPSRNSPSQDSGGHKVRLRIVIKYYDEANAFDRQLKAVSAKLLKAAGMEIVERNVPDYDLTLRISFHKEALTALYMGAGNRYTGASFSGSFFFDSLGIEMNRRYFTKRIEPPSGIASTAGTSPSDAPFELAFYSSGFFEELASVVAEKYGKEAVLQYWLAALPENIQYGSDYSPLVETAIRALGDLRDNRALDPLLKYIWRDTSVVDALEKIGKPAVDPLIAVLASKSKKSNHEKAVAAHALGRIADERASKHLARALKSEYKPLRIWSAFALYKLGDSSKIDILHAAAKERLDCDVSTALGETKNIRATEALVRLMPGNNCAEQMVKKITGRDFPTYEAWLQWWKVRDNEPSAVLTYTSGKVDTFAMWTFRYHFEYDIARTGKFITFRTKDYRGKDLAFQIQPHDKEYLISSDDLRSIDWEWTPPEGNGFRRLISLKVTMHNDSVLFITTALLPSLHHMADRPSDARNPKLYIEGYGKGGLVEERLDNQSGVRRAEFIETSWRPPVAKKTSGEIRTDTIDR